MSGTNFKLASSYVVQVPYAVICVCILVLPVVLPYELERLPKQPYLALSLENEAFRLSSSSSVDSPKHLIEEIERAFLARAKMLIVGSEFADENLSVAGSERMVFLCKPSDSAFSLDRTT